MWDNTCIEYGRATQDSATLVSTQHFIAFLKFDLHMEMIWTSSFSIHAHLGRLHDILARM